MKINYKKGLIVVVLIDLVLLGLVVIGGYRVLTQYNFKLISSDNKSVDMVEGKPAVISLHIPESVKAGEDFSLVMQIQNPNPVPIKIREIILPRLMVDNMTVTGTDPVTNMKNNYDVGEGYPFGLLIPAGEEKLISFTIKPSKMQSINTEIKTYTENFIIPTVLQFVVTP
jgi:hypothetical protein